MTGHIVVVGSLNMDLVVRVPRHPRPGETIIGGEFQTFPGGKGANQAVAAARAGSEVVMIGCVGDDAFGANLLQTLARDGVNTTYVRRDAQAPSGVALITVDADGQNAIVVASGANARLSPEDVERAQDAFTGAGALLLQLESPLETVQRAIELANARSVPVILNPAPARTLDAALFATVDYLIPNEHELFLLADIEAAEGIDTAAARLRERGARYVIVTLGGDGAAVFGMGQKIVVPPHRVSVVDTTAAGDAFVGAFGVALSELKDVEDAVRWANAAGALAVTRAGAQPSLPHRDEILQLLAKDKR
ncbi:MAG: ribokinase [Anaerolineae bacterium]